MQTVACWSIRTPSGNRFVRSCSSFYAEDVVMDGAGRVLISPTLRSYAVLDKRVMLVGQGNKFELWDEAKWQAQQESGLSFMDGELPPELEGFSL